MDEVVNVVKILNIQQSSNYIYGSGFYINSKYIVTCYHILKNYKYIYIHSNIYIRVLLCKYSEYLDLALLQVFDKDKLDEPNVCSILETNSNFYEHCCYVRGFNEIYGKILDLKGNVLSSNYISQINCDSIITNISISQGLSGSPIIKVEDNESKVIGIISWFTGSSNTLIMSGGVSSKIIDLFINDLIDLSKEHDIHNIKTKCLTLHDCVNHPKIINEWIGETITYIDNEITSKWKGLKNNDIIMKYNNNKVGYNFNSFKYLYLTNTTNENILEILRDENFIKVSLNQFK